MSYWANGVKLVTANAGATGLDGNGLVVSGNALAVQVDDSTLQLAADTLLVKDAGVTAAKITSAAGLTQNLKRTFKYQYDFAIDGGATGTITLRGDPMPSTFIIQNAELDVITLLAGGAGATGAVSTGQGAGDLVAATIVAGAPFSTTGLKITIALLGTIATQIKLTAQRAPTFAIAVNALTQGKFNLFIEGLLSN